MVGTSFQNFSGTKMKPEGWICLPVIYGVVPRRGVQPLTESISKRMRMDMHIFSIMVIMAMFFMAMLSFRSGWRYHSTNCLCCQ